MKNEMNYLERFGEKVCKSIVWRAIPVWKRLLAFNLCASTYLEILSNSSSIDEVRLLHAEHCRKSLIFRQLRPRFRDIKRSLQSLLPSTLDLAPGKAPDVSRPIPWTHQPAIKASSESSRMKLLYAQIERLSVELDRFRQVDIRDESAFGIRTDHVPFSKPINQDTNTGSTYTLQKPFWPKNYPVPGIRRNVS